jgi:hypothetical protein
MAPLETWVFVASLGINWSGERALSSPDCFKCRHLAITYEKNRPYTCQGMGFKSRLLPSLVVRRESGTDCRLFEPKPAKLDQR